MAEIEKREQIIGTSDGVCFMYEVVLACYPIVQGSVSFIPPADDTSVDHLSGVVRVTYKCPPPPGTSIRAFYAWNPPKYRDVKAVVVINGAMEAVSMDELRDAIMRGGFGR